LASSTRIQVAYARGDDRTAQRLSREFVAAYPENPAAHALLGGSSAAGLAELSAVVALLWLVLCVYSWVVPPLVRRWVRRNWR
jgi:hypothetical protein